MQWFSNCDFIILNNLLQKVRPGLFKTIHVSVFSAMRQNIIFCGRPQLRFVNWDLHELALTNNLHGHAVEHQYRLRSINSQT